MAVVETVNLNSNNLNEFDSTVVDGGDLSTSASAAAASTDYGIQLVIDDTTEIYGRGNLSSPTSNEFRLRFYLDPNGLTMSNYDKMQVFQFDSEDLVIVNLYYDGGYYIQIQGHEDDSSFPNALSDEITDDWHYIEVHVQAAGGTGSIDWWIDGVAETSITGMDNDTEMDDISYYKWGADSVDATISGTFYMDELVINDDGNEIGPVATAEEVSVSVGRSLAATAARQVTMEAGVGLGVTRTSGLGRVALVDRAVSLGAVQTITEAGLATAAGELAAAISRAVVSGGIATSPQAMALGKATGLVSAGQVSAIGALAAGIFASVDNGADAAASAGVSVGRVPAIFAAGGVAAEAIVPLARGLVQALVGAAAASGEVQIQRDVAMVDTGATAAGADVTVGRVVTAEALGQLDVSVSLSLARSGAVAQSGTAAAEALQELSYVSGIVALGQAVTYARVSLTRDAATTLGAGAAAVAMLSAGRALAVVIDGTTEAGVNVSIGLALTSGVSVLATANASGEVPALVIQQGIVPTALELAVSAGVREIVAVGAVRVIISKGERAVTARSVDREIVA